MTVKVVVVLAVEAETVEVEMVEAVRFGFI